MVIIPSKQNICVILEGGKVGVHAGVGGNRRTNRRDLLMLNTDGAASRWWVRCHCQMIFNDFSLLNRNCCKGRVLEVN
jgi:hypothetical protein